MFLKKIGRTTLKIVLLLLVVSLLLYTIRSLRCSNCTDAIHRSLSLHSQLLARLHSHQVSLVLLDPALLAAHSGYRPRTQDEQLFPVDMRLLTLGMLAKEAHKIPEIQEEALSAGYRSHIVTEVNTNQSSFQSAKFPTQLVLVYSSNFLKTYVLQLVVLHERQNAYYWTGGLNLSRLSDQKPLLSKLRWVFDVPRAFNFFPLREERFAGSKLPLLLPQDVGTFLWHLPASRFLECNYTRAEAFLKKYPNRSKKDSTVKRAIEILRHKMHLHNVRVWIMGGTLLGWYRQCGVIPYTTDIDFGVWSHRYSLQLEKAFQSPGPMKLRYRFGLPSDSLEFVLRGLPMKVDVFFYYAEHNHTWTGGMRTKDRTKVKYVYPQFTLCSCELAGALANIPCNPQSFVQANYGDSWETPKSHWNWSYAPLNIRENGRWPQNLWKSVFKSF